MSLRINPEVRSHILNPRHAATRGRVVARVVNDGPGLCQALQLAQGDTAYWWMGPTVTAPLKTVFWRIPSSGPVVPVAKTAPTLVFGEPQHLVPNARISELIMHPVRDEGDGGWGLFGHNSTWIACLGGCCESNNLMFSNDAD